MAISRRKFLGLSAGVLAAGVVGTSLWEPHEVSVSQIDITLKRLPSAFDGVRIAQLSDIHFNSFMTSGHLDRVVNMTNALKPDMVLLTGDFVTAGVSGRGRNASAEQAWPCSDILRRIVAPLGCFAVLGNHDYDTKANVVAEALAAGGRIQVLRNQASAIEKDGDRLWLAGMDDVIRSRPNPDRAMRGVPKQECKILAVHEPDIADEMMKYSVDLQVSGHSHGGQVRFPGVGALYLPRGAEKYPMGHYQIGELQLYTNRGIGVIGLPIRFLCPPEITLFTLRQGIAG